MGTPVKFESNNQVTEVFELFNDEISGFRLIGFISQYKCKTR